MNVGIPVPPFRSADEHKSFRLALGLWLARFDEEGVSLSTMGLLGALELGAADAESRLTRLELAVAATSWFPVPWTLVGLVRAAEVSIPYLHMSKDWRGRVRSVSWGTDPDFSATRRGDGWVVNRAERGSHSVSAEPPDDAGLMAILLEWLRFEFPYPYGSVVREVEGLDAELPAARARWAERRSYPYLEEWRGTRP